MRVRHHSSSSSSDDEHRSKRDHDRVRYVRRQPSPERSHSYERRRPKNHHRDSSSRRRKAATPSDDSDNDTVYKVDRYGRRYHRSSCERRSSRERHAGREDPAYMSGALACDVEPSLECLSSVEYAKIITEESPGRWSTIAGPFKVNVHHPRESQQEEHGHCRCRRCRRGRPGSREDCHHRRSGRSSRARFSRSSSSRTATPKSRSPGPRGILKRESSRESSRPRLRKSVSFGSGTKIPHDHQEPVGRRPRDRGERTSSPGRVHEGFEQCRWAEERTAVEQRPAPTPEAFHEAYTQQSRAQDADIEPERPTEIESPDSDTQDDCRRSHVFKSSSCQQCHHCPRDERPRKRGRKKPRMQTRSSKATLSRHEEQLRSVTHSILLSTHQSWCGGACANLSKFVQQKGGCSACCLRKANFKRTAGAQATPHCRTLIHCHKLGHGIFPAQGSTLPARSMVDRALRLGYADVYCCSMGGYLTPEEYLAYRRGGIGDLEYGLRTKTRSAREHTGIAAEVEKSMVLWSTIMSCVRQKGQPCSEEALLQVLEDMVTV